MSRSYFVVLATVISLFSISSSRSQALDKVDFGVLADELVECGGIYGAMSEVLKGMDKPSASQTYKDTGRGAYLAAAYLKFISRKISDFKKASAWAENTKETRKTYWLGLMELYTPTQESVFPQDYMAGLKYCTSLNPIQTEIVEMMRKEIYK